LPTASSLGSIFKNIHEKVETEDDTHKVALTKENVVELWKQFLEDNKQNLQNAFLSVALLQVPMLVDDRVTFTLTNNISYEMMQLHGTDITVFYREKTTHRTVSPHFILIKEESTTKSYKTDKDRLGEMIEKNSAVLKLIEKFNLQMEI